MVEWAHSVGWDQWAMVVCLMLLGALIGHVRYVGYKLNMQDERRRKDVEA